MANPDLPVFVGFGFVLVLLVLLLIWSLWAVRHTRQKPERAGFRGIGDYIRAAPRTDAERKDAVELMMRGVALCLLGVVPLDYGGRKITLSALYFGSRLNLIFRVENGSDLRIHREQR